MRPLCCLLVLIGLSGGAAFAQQVPSSREPGKNNGIYSPRHTKTVKRKRQKVEHSAQYEFYQRVEEAAKEKQRILKYLDKRQFKDHWYFGHKRIPKRRPPHKMRYCNECGVRH